MASRLALAGASLPLSLNFDTSNGNIISAKSFDLTRTASLRVTRSARTTSTKSIKSFDLMRTPSFTGPSSIMEKSSAMYSELDHLIEEHEDSKGIIYIGAKAYTKIKRNHWIDVSKRQVCNVCKKTFGFTSKKFNCRRCGEVFCESCCQYRRRLSPKADPDPDGNLYRVCYNCADLHVQEYGQSRSLMHLFHDQQKNRRINVVHELNRLVDGFKTNIKASRIKTAMVETFSNLKVPLWQRSHKWVESSEAEWCGKCSGKFTMLMTKHHCRICGAVFCYKCSKPDLMLFYEDNETAKWALIGLIGCPDSEPDICLYLTVCLICHEEIEDVQVHIFYADRPELDEAKNKMMVVSGILERLSGFQTKIRINLMKFQEMVENMLEGKDKLNEISDSGQNVVQTFAKIQVDISDLFTQYAVVIQGLKQCKMVTKTELKLMSNIIASKSSYYNKNMANYKLFKDNLNKILPASALKQIQDYSNKQAINNTHIMTRQLGYEALDLALRYQFETTIAKQVSAVDEICLSELHVFVKDSGEDWQEHSDRLNELLKMQLKSHRLIVPSKALAARDGEKYVKSFLMERSHSILQQVLRQLDAKSAETKFQKSKEALQKLLQNFE